jgi:hypothetical protein
MSEATKAESRGICTMCCTLPVNGLLGAAQGIRTNGGFV